MNCKFKGCDNKREAKYLVFVNQLNATPIRRGQDPYWLQGWNQLKNAFWSDSIGEGFMWRIGVKFGKLGRSYCGKFVPKWVEEEIRIPAVINQISSTPVTLRKIWSYTSERLMHFMFISTHFSRWRHPPAHPIARSPDRPPTTRPLGRPLARSPPCQSPTQPTYVVF